MRASALIILVLAASPVEAKPWQCVLWPKTCQMDEAIPAPPEPVQTAPVPPPPIPPPPPAVAPPPAPAPRVMPPAPKIAAPKRIKSNFAKPKRKTVTVQASWCAKVPSWATLSMIEAAASTRGVTMTEGQRQQALKCLESKRVAK